MAFLDVRKAFDTVSRDTVVRAKERLGVPAQLNDYIKSTLADVRLEKKLITSLLFQLKALRQQGRSVVLNWVPGHIGIQGNEAADRVARRAAAGDMEGGIGVLPSRTEILAIATRTMAKRELQSHRNLTAQRPSARWYQVATAYERLTPGVRLSRIEEVTLHRLRLGYRCFSEVTGQPEA
ncbi:uncharacterized protein LOC143018714 [Oratosquilla oratoria]|uniref:uncharacterized protein LOC143018714 n=1 Tax=Oratosquilla oratoria TaxID=337810 RepID=UPI003F76A79D